MVRRPHSFEFKRFCFIFLVGVSIWVKIYPKKKKKYLGKGFFNLSNHFLMCLFQSCLLLVPVNLGSLKPKSIKPQAFKQVLEALARVERNGRTPFFYFYFYFLSFDNNSFKSPRTNHGEWTTEGGGLAVRSVLLSGLRCGGPKFESCNGKCLGLKTVKPHDPR